MFCYQYYNVKPEIEQLKKYRFTASWVSHNLNFLFLPTC
jgi:hypothetical protein